MALPYRSRTLFRGPLLAILDATCSAGRGGAGPEEHEEQASVVFPRAGVFVRHAHGESWCCDALGAHFFDSDHVYRVSHPVDNGSAGDASTVIRPSTEALRGLCAELGLLPRDGEPRFPHANGPVSPAAALAHRRLHAALRAGRASALEAEEVGLALVADAIAAAVRVRGDHLRSAGAATRARRRELAHAARAHVAARYRERTSLAGLARALDASPFHLARVFRAEFGLPLHRCALRLRLVEAAARVIDGEADLTALALDLGFADHAHLTNAFAREFGLPPSALRRPPERGSSSKILQARLPPRT